jgi:hypothetical protein
MNKTTARREQRPEQFKNSTKAEIPANDPNYHYRIVSKEDDVKDRVEHHRDLGYGIAKSNNRAILMGCKKEDHEQRQREAKQRADRMRESMLPQNEGLVHDETTLQVTRGLHTEDD